MARGIDGEAHRGALEAGSDGRRARVRGRPRLPGRARRARPADLRAGPGGLRVRARRRAGAVAISRPQPDHRRPRAKRPSSSRPASGAARSSRPTSRSRRGGRCSRFPARSRAPVGRDERAHPTRRHPGHMRGGRTGGVRPDTARRDRRPRWARRREDLSTPARRSADGGRAGAVVRCRPGAGGGGASSSSSSRRASRWRMACIARASRIAVRCRASVTPTCASRTPLVAVLVRGAASACSPARSRGAMTSPLDLSLALRTSALPGSCGVSTTRARRSSSTPAGDGSSRRPAVARAGRCGSRASRATRARALRREVARDRSGARFPKSSFASGPLRLESGMRTLGRRSSSRPPALRRGATRRVLDVHRACSARDVHPVLMRDVTARI